MIVEPAHVPVVMVPNAVKDELVIPVPIEDALNTEVFAILYTNPDARLKDSFDDQPVPVYQLINLSVAPLRVIPPASAVISEGEFTEPNSIFLSSTVRVTELIVVVVPLTVRSPFIVKLPPMPTPPVTTSAPVLKVVEANPDVTAKPETDRISVEGL